MVFQMSRSEPCPSDGEKGSASALEQRQSGRQRRERECSVKRVSSPHKRKYRVPDACTGRDGGYQTTAGVSTTQGSQKMREKDEIVTRLTWRLTRVWKKTNGG